ncbi:MAG TPA: cupin domain-containing protein, partial [Rhodanobacteraceae bacterium]
GQRLGMPVDVFLRDYWQKRPLLIRAAFPGFELPLQPDDLGGLACEDGALSRLIEHDRARDQWTVHHGPLDEDLFARLPDRDWTVLVQDVDKWDADVARLLEDFRFLPSWRVDDVMISYAEDAGGVGAHVDQYDVFLLQGHGQRRWRIDARPNPPTGFRDDVEIKQLREFSPSHDWLLEPGDMLYLPPGVPHDGTAVGPCMTFSVGMRAPAVNELLLDAAEYLAERLPETARYSDPDLVAATHAGEITPVDLARVAKTLGPLADNLGHGGLVDWFGRFITRYRCAQFAAPAESPLDAAELTQRLARGDQLWRHPWARFAWCGQADTVQLFAAGEALPCPRDLAENLCTHAAPTFGTAPTPAAAAVLVSLVNNGQLTFAA